MPNQTNITPPRVAFLDPKTGLISREWYRFFLNLFVVTGGGTNTTTIPDLLVSPIASDTGFNESIITPKIQALEINPSVDSIMSFLAQLSVEIEGLKQSIATVRIEDIQKLITNIQALNSAPLNTPQIISPRYGVFHDTTTQTAAVINTAYAITFDSTDISNGVYIGSPTSRVYVDRPGAYNFQFSAQLDKSSASAADVYLWADINGVTQANTGTKITLAGSSAATVAAWNFVFSMNAGDYFRLMWSVSNTACQITAAAAAAPVPAIPSVILTVTDNIGSPR